MHVNAHEGVVEFLKGVEWEEELRDVGGLHHVVELDKGGVVVGLEVMLELEERACRVGVREMPGIGNILKRDGEVGAERPPFEASFDEAEEVMGVKPDMGCDHSKETAYSCAVRTIQNEPVGVLAHLFSDGLGIEVDGGLDAGDVCDANGVSVGEGGCCLVDVGCGDDGLEFDDGVEEGFLGGNRFALVVDVEVGGVEEVEHGGEFGLVGLGDARELLEGLGMDRVLGFGVLAGEHFAEKPMKALEGGADEDDAGDGEEDADEKPTP